jgi:predicted dehydrogenase
MSQKRIRIAAIGCGRVAQHYRRILDSGVVKNFEMVGFSDSMAERSAEFAQHFGCKAYTNHEQMLDELKPDLVLVLTPSGHHYLHTRIAIERNLNVLVEKPITMLPGEAEELNALAKKHDVMYAAAFQNRLNPAIRCLQRAIERGRFGKIVTATVRLRWCRHQSYYEDGWHGTWMQDGGVINQQAIHHVDALNWLLGPVEAVCVATSNRLNQLEAEDTLVAAVRYESGALGTIEATTAARPEDLEASLSVVGEKGMALIGGIALNKIETWTFVEKEPEDADAVRLHSQEVPTGYGLSHGPLLQEIVDRLLRGEKTPPVTAEDALRTTELVHALYRSDEINGWVALKDKPVSERLGKANAKA